MKRYSRRFAFSITMCLCWVALVTLLCSDSFAAEKITTERKIYNILMLWVNFGILATVFFKFARKPLMNAIRGMRDKIAGELSAIKKGYEDAKSALDTEENKLKNIDKHLEEIQKRLIEIGEKEKEKIVNQAKLAAEKMIEDAKAYASFQMAKARKKLSDEMVDIAISVAEERLKKEMSKEDNERLIGEFLVNIEATKLHLN